MQQVELPSARLSESSSHLVGSRSRRRALGPIRKTTIASERPVCFVRQRRRIKTFGGHQTWMES